MSEHEPKPSDEQPATSAAEPTRPLPDAQPADSAPSPDEQQAQPLGAEQTESQQTGYQDPGYQGAGYQDPGYQSAGYQEPGYQGGGYPPGGYPPAGYPPGGYAYPAAAPPTDDKATWALVSSIVGFILCPIVLHVVGWVLANQSLARIRASGGTVGGEGIAKAARVLGIVGVVLYGALALLGILVLAVLVPLGVFAASTSTQDFNFGDETVAPATLSDIDGETFSHDAGDVEYDLTDIDFGTGDSTMSVELGAGSLTIEVPDDVSVTVDAQVGAGQMELFDQQVDGVNLDETTTSEATGSEATLELDLSVGLGDLQVVRD